MAKNRVLDLANTDDVSFAASTLISVMYERKEVGKQTAPEMWLSDYHGG